MLRLIRYSILIIVISCRGWAAEERTLGGSVEAEGPNGTLTFPLLHSDISADISGDLATVRITQTFSNPSTEPLNATYLFPLHHEAAVYKMQMEVGDEIIEAKIKKKEEAEKTFEQAKQEGKAAALLTQYRPNMFTQKIANLMPGVAVKVTLSYVQSVPKVDGMYELVMPLVVGPRYQPEGAGIKPMGTTETRDVTPGKWELEELPAYPQVAGLDIPDTIEKGRVGITVHLHAGMEIGEVSSATHPLNVETQSKEEKIVTLAEGRTIDNRDFVLHYRLAGAGVKPGMLAHRDARGGYFSLMIEPPALPFAEEIAAREFVFVLDTSGSMSGQPLEASKLFMQQALKHLRPGDYFRILHFGSNAEEFTSAPVRATPENLKAGEAYVESLSADGGTEMDRALTQAFSIPQQPNTLRMVVFLTDGYIGNESTILGHLREEIGAARVYALGVGSSVNRFLLEEMARTGRGSARFIDPTKQPEETAIAFANKLETPVLTDISVDWGKLKPKDVAPEMIPDLFTESNIRLQGRYTQPGTYEIRISGKVNGRAATLPLTVNLPEKSDAAAEAIPLIWARTMVQEKMRQLDLPSYMKKGVRDQQLEADVTQLGLDYALVTRWTSFVAVSRKVVNHHPENAIDANVPLHKVVGVSEKTYGDSLSSAMTGIAKSQEFASSAAPEPATWAGLALMALLGCFTMRRDKRIGA